jgi:translation initiation factor IF-3
LNTKHVKVNHHITAPELRVLDDSGKNLGVISKADALKYAEEKGLDLIEISPNAKPPVARIYSFDKFRYDEEKKAKKQKKLQKNVDMKQVQVSVRSAKNDLDIKARRADAFLKEGHSVSIVMVLRGREKANRDWALKKLDEFLRLIRESFTIVMPPKRGGRGFITHLIKKQ